MTRFAATTALRKAIIAERVPLEENDFASGVNQGLRTALAHVDVYIRTLLAHQKARKLRAR